MSSSYVSVKLESSIHHVMATSASSDPALSQGNNKLLPVLAKKSAPIQSSMSSPISNMGMGSIPASTQASSSSSLTSPELLRCKRRINFGALGYALPQTQPATVARRNERERNRVKMVNMGFATLRQHVPNGAKNKKMSKVETLRSAVEYIRELQQLLGDTDDIDCTSMRCQESMQRQSTSSDENWNPSPSTLSSTGALQSPSAMSFCNPTSINTAMAQRKSNSPASPLMANSPSPSMGSDASSPYDSLDSIDRQVSPEEEDFGFDLATWFS